MADTKKYKLGELEFNTEQEYREAALDLKRIKELMAKYDLSNPEQSRRILTTIRAHPESFRSPYGKKFVEKLERTVGKSAPAEPKRNSDTTEQIHDEREIPKPNTKPEKKEKLKKEKGPKREKRPKKEKKNKPPKEDRQKNTKKKSFQIFTIRNFAIGIVIIAGIIIFSIFADQIFSINTKGVDNNGDIKRNMITAYAKNQADLKAELYTYYFNVVGETEEEAKKDADEGIGQYVLDLSDRTISTMTDSEITDIYDRLVEGGDIQNHSFVEPAEVTVLKDKLFSAGISGNTGNGNSADGETSVIAAINNMMDYQQRIYHSLCYNYSLLSYNQENCSAYALEDMEAMFGDVIFDMKMSEKDKENYFEIFQKRGLIKDNQVVRFSTDPTAYNLPELTSTFEISLNGKKTDTYRCSMISYVPAASVFYEFHSEDEKGYICFRNNGENTKYIQLDEETSVTAQGDFFMIRGKKIIKGEWFYNKQDIGILLNGDQSSLIRYVYDLTY